MKSANLRTAWAVVNSYVVIKKLCSGIGAFIWRFFTVVMGLGLFLGGLFCFVWGFFGLVSFCCFEGRGARSRCTSRAQAKSTSKGGTVDGCGGEACVPLCSRQKLARKIMEIPSEPFRLRAGTWHIRMWCDSQDYSMMMLLKSISLSLDHKSSCWLLFYSICNFFLRIHYLLNHWLWHSQEVI